MKFKYTSNKQSVDKICCVDGCCNKIDGKHKDYCNKHYKQIYTHGEIQERTVFTPNEINIINNHAEIVLYNKYNDKIGVAIIDIDDIDKCKNYKWGINGNGYARNGKHNLFLHNLILNIDVLPKDLVCDHINRNRLDNRKSNLRIITNSENCFNRNNVRGYSYNKNTNKYAAYIKRNGHNVYLGQYDNKREAIDIRLKWENKYFKNIKYYEKVSS